MIIGFEKMEIREMQYFYYDMEAYIITQKIQTWNL